MLKRKYLSACQLNQILPAACGQSTEWSAYVSASVQQRCAAGCNGQQLYKRLG